MVFLRRKNLWFLCSPFEMIIVSGGLFFRDSDDVGMTYLQIGYQIGDQAHTVRIYNAEVDRVHFT